ncbi:AraC family transcriptional regulator [Paenibacillus spongiae]|uniref:AraC family transcriptional regulator n=1 Tax=Paenibacillus spongiae TaxID=2909671 RepID=A0ABY5SHI2_9BACL|nr:AraC family transcriptional regulator [Paenibacillus spongiae]UVI33406.1 AraC family transcriptional regulator [Paenibacillus spongiae]
MKINNEQNHSARWGRNGADFGVPQLETIGFDHVKKALTLTEHYHKNCYEFVVMEKGRASWVVGEERYETRTGDVFHTLPNEKHRGSFNVIEPCRLWWVMLNVQQRDEDGRWLGLSRSEELSLLHLLQKVRRVTQPGTQAVRSLRRIKQTMEQGSNLPALNIRLALLDLLLSLTDIRERKHISPDLIQSMDCITCEMETRPEWNPQLHELAAIAKVSPSYFHHIFQEHKGLTPKGYMEYIKISEAAKLLKETEMSVTEIALRLGYSSSQHFATAFGRTMGQTPTRWRG